MKIFDTDTALLRCLRKKKERKVNKRAVLTMIEVSSTLFNVFVPAGVH